MYEVMPTATVMPSRRMGDFLLSLRAETLPTAVIRDSRMRLLDSLACELYASLMPWSKIAAAGFINEEQSRGGATLYGYGDPIAPARAALVNGTAIHRLELDDTRSRRRAFRCRRCPSGTGHG